MRNTLSCHCFIYQWTDCKSLRNDHHHPWRGLQTFFSTFKTNSHYKMVEWNANKIIFQKRINWLYSHPQCLAEAQKHIHFTWGFVCYNLLNFLKVSTTPCFCMIHAPTMTHRYLVTDVHFLQNDCARSTKMNLLKAQLNCDTLLCPFWLPKNIQTYQCVSIESCLIKDLWNIWNINTSTLHYFRKRH